MANPHPKPEVLPPSIGRFQPRRVLGHGGQGIVYLAVDPKLDREVAIKTLNHRARDPDKLINEARTVARLDHPNIVPLFEIELEHEPPYLVYQFASGQPLSTFCGGNETMPINRAVQILIQVLDAVQYAHQNGILHRDLTPANILIDEAGHPRILDFGISIALGSTLQPHELAGTANYLAPEVLANQPATASADVFALSVVLHEMLTGKRLFRADNPMAVMYKILNEPVLPPSLARDGVDQALDRIVMHGLERDPALRYASAGAMRDALKDYLAPPARGPAAASDAAGAIAFLQRRIQRKPDFPAIARHVAEINQKADSRDASHVNELASIILKDYALTTKLLKIANSAVYGQYGGSISTVSRAVVILGLERVRAIALGIVIFEHLKSGEQAEALKDAACSSFLSGMLAKGLVQHEQPRLNPEEAFIGAMFHRLGRHLAIYYFPDEYREVRALMESKNLDEAAAAREIFGADFSEFGIAIGREWNLPERLLDAMRPQRKSARPAGWTPEALIAQYSAFSNEAAELAASGAGVLDQRLELLLQRYRDCVKADTRQLKTAVTAAVAATRDYADLLGLDLEASPLLGKVALAVAEPAHAGAADADPEQRATIAADELAPEPADGNRRHLFLTNAIAELTNAIVEKASLNDMFAMVLEALYRSMEFTHVLLLIRDPARRTYLTRFGFGDRVDELKSSFEYTPAGAEDIFAQAVLKGRNAVIIDTSDERYRSTIPEWCREATRPQSILVFAVVVNKVCIGLIYADTCDRKLRISAQELQLLNTLVRQLALGVQTR